jgi:hypothetical protein
MMGAGLERQLDRCNSGSVPDFCSNSTLHNRILQAYNHLWDLIEANSGQLSSEVWSWVYQDGGFQVTPLGALPPPPGTSPTGRFSYFVLHYNVEDADQFERERCSPTMELDVSRSDSEREFKMIIR